MFIVHTLRSILHSIHLKKNVNDLNNLLLSVCVCVFITFDVFSGTGNVHASQCYIRKEQIVHAVQNRIKKQHNIYINKRQYTFRDKCLLCFDYCVYHLYHILIFQKRKQQISVCIENIYLISHRCDIFLFHLSCCRAGSC